MVLVPLWKNGQQCKNQIICPFSLLPHYVIVQINKRELTVGGRTVKRMEGKPPVKIIESIGDRNDELGTHLLNDRDGSIMATIQVDQ